jgi:Tol biopolymer transport system component/predicted Ser/Thr protein kinase
VADGARVVVPATHDQIGRPVSGEPDWARVKTVFQSALEQPEDLRPAFVAEACGDDSPLRTEVESLLIAHAAAGGFASSDAVASLTMASLYDLSGADRNLVPGARVGHYEIVDLVGRGSMGHIFKAHDVRLGRVVAIKVLSPDLAPDPASRARFDREAKTIASLNHPHICTLFDIGHDERFDYLVMEYLEGDTLTEIFERGALSVETTRRYAAEMIDALDAAHRRGVVHRDLKPANVMVADGRTKLLDFGVAKMIAHDGLGPISADAVHGTQDGSVIGTAGYMSPEQARGQAVDKRADIWAFGCLLFEMLSGHPAFRRDTYGDTLVVVLEREPEWALLPSTTPRSLLRLMRRCLEKDPDRRLRDIADARADIDDGDAGMDQNERAARPSRVVRALPWAIAVGAIGLAGLVIMQTRREVPRPSPLRLAIVPPEGTTWAPFDISGAPQFALSPDGRQIAMVVADAARVSRLWIRALDSTNGRPLTGTDHASGPFWSPDGAAIAFFADRKLKEVRIESGSVQELADVAQTVAGGSWSRDGTILFGGPGGGLLRVSAEGGPVETVAAVDAGAGELAYAWPQFLSDGRRFLFYVRNRDRAATGIYVGSLDSRIRSFVLPSAVRAIHAPTGHLLFEQAGTLMAQAFDGASAGLTAQAIALPDRVVPLPGPGWLPISAGGEAIAYWSGDGRPTFDLNVVDRSGHAIQRVLPPGQYLGLDLSPDGSRALVTERTGSEADALSMIELKTGARVRATLAPGIAHFGIWAPDSAQVVYSSLEDGVPRLYRKAVRGNTPEVPVIPSLRQPNMVPTDWSRDGQWVLYAAPGPLAWDLFALRVSDSSAHPVVQAPQNQVQGRLSPNARWIAYASDESGRFEVYVQSFDDARNKTLVSTHGGSQPTWRRDGHELFYVAADGAMMAVPVRSESRFEHGAEVKLFQTQSQEVLTPFAPSYAAGDDGREFLIRSELPSGPYRTITVVTNGVRAAGSR